MAALTNESFTYDARRRSSVVTFWLYREYRVDVFRQSMFKLRDELFDFAHRGEISFDDPAYHGLRRMCNGYIRFGHRLSLWSAILFSWGLKPAEAEWIDENGFSAFWAHVNLDAPTRQALDEFRSRMTNNVINQVVLGSPVLVATVVPALSLKVMVELPLEVIRRTRARFIYEMDEAAFALGQAA